MADTRGYIAPIVTIELQICKNAFQDATFPGITCHGERVRKIHCYSKRHPQLMNFYQLVERDETSMRKLSPSCLNCLKSGFLSAISEYVRRDHDLNLEIRDNYIN